ncbi:MAG: peptidoglycan-binding protein [Hyphomicrobiaceae bacterium]
MFVKPMRVLAVSATATVLLCAPSLAAKECKDEVKATGEASVSRSLIAYPSSLLAWRKAAESAYGAEYRAWRNASDRKIDCKQQSEGKKLWVCTRVAKPCTGEGILSIVTGGSKPILTERLKLRDEGDQVKVLQQLLRAQGYDLEVDGNFGSGTLKAVRDFQSREGLKVDGIVGTATRDRLMS